MLSPVKLPKERLNIRLIASDLDDTLLNKKSELTKETIRTLRRAADRGIQIVLCSGRSPDAMMQFISALALADRPEGRYVIAFNGAQIYDLVERVPIYESTVDSNLLKKAYSLAKENNLPCVVYRDGVMYSWEDSYWARLDSVLCRVNFQVVEDFYNFLELGFPKMLIPGEPASIARITPILREELGQDVELYTSRPDFLDITSCNIGKGQTLTKLVEILGLDPKKVLTFGDGENDCSMLDSGGTGGFLGLSCAMCNGVEKAKECATFITERDNDEDGVAHFINKFVIG